MRFIKLALICLALGLTGCAAGVKYQDLGSFIARLQPTVQPDIDQTTKHDVPKQEPNIFLPIEPPHDDVAAIKVEKVAFKLGLSSRTVEKLAKQRGCDSSIGAGLITDGGPVEVYRMNCQDGSVFLARCELRQCKSM